jgi:hypothetical protein
MKSLARGRSQYCKLCSQILHPSSPAFFVIMPFDSAVPARFLGIPGMSVYRNQPGLSEPHRSGTAVGSFSHPFVVDESDDSDDGGGDDYSPAVSGDIGFPD